MTELIIIHNKNAVTTSLQVAESFEKRHDNVLRDIEALKKDVLNFEEMFIEGETPDSYNRMRKTYFMNRDGFTLLAMGFTGSKALEFKLKYMKAFNEMEERLKEQQSPTTFLEAMELVVQKEKERLLLEENNKQLLVENEEMKPKVSYLEEIMKNKTLVTVSQIAKDYGMGAPSFNNMLNSHGVQYKQSGVWHLYAQYQDKGYTQSFTYKGDFKPSTRWTNKGRKFLYNVLKEKGVVPLIERESHEFIL